MTEQLDFGWVYDTTPLTTFRMMTRLDHRTEEARHLEHQDHSVLELRAREELFRAVTQRQFQGDGVSRGSRLFGSKPVLKQSVVWQPADWDGSRRFEFNGEISALSVTILGGGSLSPAGASTTRYTVGLTVHSSGRGGGRRTEAAGAQSLGHTLQAEHEFRLLWLRRQSSSF